MKSFFLIFISLQFFIHPLHSQNLDELTDNEKAIYFFTEGKIKELQLNYYQALENYQTALKYDNSPGILYAISKLYFQIDKYNEAFNFVTDALKSEPNNLEYLEHQGNVYMALDNYQKAAEVYERIIASKPDDVYGLYALARIYQRLDMPSNAIVIYEKITDNIGYDYDILRRMYSIYFKDREYDKCIEVLNAVLKLDPFDREVREQLAGLYNMLNRPDEAKEIFQDLADLNPQDKELQTELVKSYFFSGAIEKGFEGYAKILGYETLTYQQKLEVGQLYYNLIRQDTSAIQMAENIFNYLTQVFPDKWISYYYLGALEIVRKNFDAFPYKFEQALVVADTIREAYLQIGFVYYEQGKFNDANRVLRRAVDMNPQDEQSLLLYGVSLQSSGDIRTAIEYLEKAHQINPDEVSTISTLAIAYHNIGQIERSNELYEMGLKIDPNNATLLNNYAYNLSERNEKLDEALEMSKKSIEKEPRNSSFLDTLGWIYYKLGQFDLALKYIRQSLDISPDNSVVNDHLGDIYLARDDISNALKFWEKALEFDPENNIIKSKIEQYS